MVARRGSSLQPAKVRDINAILGLLRRWTKARSVIFIVTSIPPTLKIWLAE